MIRRIARGISKRWERKFRVEGYNAINGLAIAYQADLRKRMLAKLKKQFDDLQRGFALPDPNTTYINSFDEVPHMKFARDKLKELIAKVEKECGPLKLEISKERNPFDRTVDINEKGFRRLWEEINKDKDTLTKIMGPMAAILNNFGEFEEECLKKQSQSQRSQKSTEVVTKENPAMTKSNDMLETLKVLRTEYSKLAHTTDMCRIDIGLIIMRPPLFLQYSPPLSPV